MISLRVISLLTERPRSFYETLYKYVAPNGVKKSSWIENNYPVLAVDFLEIAARSNNFTHA